jgi:hypothetical protein
MLEDKKQLCTGKGEGKKCPYTGKFDQGFFCTNCKRLKCTSCSFLPIINQRYKVYKKNVDSGDLASNEFGQV